MARFNLRGLRNQTLEFRAEDGSSLLLTSHGYEPSGITMQDLATHPVWYWRPFSMDEDARFLFFRHLSTPGLIERVELRANLEGTRLELDIRRNSDLWDFNGWAIHGPRYSAAIDLLSN